MVLQGRKSEIQSAHIFNSSIFKNNWPIVIDFYVLLFSKNIRLYIFIQLLNAFATLINFDQMHLG